MKGENDGLLQRFQLLVYPDENKKKKYIDRKPDSVAKQRAYDLIQKIATMNFQEAGAKKEELDKFCNFRFTPEAQDLAVKFFMDIENNKLQDDEYSPIFKQHLSKYSSFMPSLALVFHLINLADGAKDEGGVSLTVTKQAINWCKVMESHAYRVYHGIGNTGNQAAIALQKRIIKGDLNNPFTLREVQRKGWYLLTDRSSIDKAVFELEQASCLIKVYQDSGIGRPKTEYHINPALLPK